HELRTPLTALQGFSEILAARSLAPEEVRRMAGIMRAEAARLGRIVSDLLDLSRIERGLEPTLPRVPVGVEAARVAPGDPSRRRAGAGRGSRRRDPRRERARRRHARGLLVAGRSLTLRVAGV